MFCLEAVIQQRPLFSTLPQDGLTLASACIQTLPANVTMTMKNWVRQFRSPDVLVILCVVFCRDSLQITSLWVYIGLCFGI